MSTTLERDGVLSVERLVLGLSPRFASIGDEDDRTTKAPVSHNWGRFFGRGSVTVNAMWPALTAGSAPILQGRIAVGFQRRKSDRLYTTAEKIWGRPMRAATIVRARLLLLLGASSLVLLTQLQRSCVEPSVPFDLPLAVIAITCARKTAPVVAPKSSVALGI
jgi:hypothetical protein